LSKAIVMRLEVPFAQVTTDAAENLILRPKPARA